MAKVVSTQGQSIKTLPKIWKHSSTSFETLGSKRLRKIIRIYDRRVYVISSKKTKDKQRILSQDFFAILIFLS